MSVVIWLEDEARHPSEIRVNTGLNFGRIFPEQTTRSFRVEIMPADLHWLAPEWRSTALEMATDDQLDDEPSPFHRLGYDPVLAHAWKNPAALAAIVEMFFTRSILNHFFKSADASRAWTINGLSSVHVANDRLVLVGWAVC